jgi:K(+)-stimulated pyrophosphate-energized sodium pump
MGKCDMSKCATMTKDQCAAMCDSLKCSPEQKEMCLSHYDANGKFVAQKEGTDKSCCVEKGDKNVNVTITNDNGKAKATVITTEKGKATTQVFEGSLKDVKAKVEAME